jgi:alginate O-acetyltransferase complex protein AlgI
MVFSSVLFIFIFLPLFLLVYYLTPGKYKNITILIFSILFYSWGGPKFIFVILGTTFIDFHIVRWMYFSEKNSQRHILLILSICMNVGLLFYFKYSNFFVENVNVLLSLFGIKAFGWTKLVLPIGISFYTFETITYVMDVYRKVHKPLTNFWDYQLYIILFPKLIAGPIIRYHDLADQISDRSSFDTIDNRLIGFYRFIIGLSKKVLIANSMGLQADTIMNMDYSLISTYTAWIGILAYTFQIYFDFSGYSDMAIGIAKMIGFNFPENFHNPYISQSITEFWRRWHISLGKWMRNYLYIPLGGNRVKTKSRLYFNLWLVFLASGFWHGASWSFIIWGAYHGLFLVLERGFLLKIYSKIGKFPSMIICFIIVNIGWVFFRIENINDALKYISRLFSFNFEHRIVFDSELYTLLAISFIFAFFTAFSLGEKIQNAIYFNNYSFSKHIGVSIIILALFLVSVSSIIAYGFNPFIYFRF